MSGELYLKWTRTGQVPAYRGGEPIPYRKWTKPTTPILCRSGWHACRWEDALEHIWDELWVVQLDGRIVEGDDKVVGERLRIVRKVSGINDRTLRLFAADCAESVLHIFERECPGDERPRLAIEAARLFANGQIGDAARAAAEDAARAASRAAAWDVARDASRAAARAASRAAAWDAAWDAARAAAGDAARDAQLLNLLGVYGGLDPADFAHRPAVAVAL